MSHAEGGPRAIPEAKWDVHKARIRDLYVDHNRTLKDIREHMRVHYKFEASKQQYERQFKKWSFKKNLTQSQWNDLHVLLKKRQLDVDDVEVLVDGRVLPARKLKKELARKPRLTPALDPQDELSSSAEGLHPNFVIRPLKERRTILSSILNLPISKFFAALSKCLHEQSERSDEDDPRSRRHTLDLDTLKNMFASHARANKHKNDVTETDITGAVRYNTQDQVLAEFKALVPNFESSIIDTGVYTSREASVIDRQLFSDPYMTALFCVICLLLNNTSNECLEKNLSQLLLMPESRVLWRTLRSSSSAGSRVIVHAIFRIACERFHVLLLRKLLMRKCDLETPIPDKVYGSSTALQVTVRRIRTWDKSNETRGLAESFVSELLNHGVDPNRSASPGSVMTNHICSSIPASKVVICSKGYHNCSQFPLSILLEKPRSSFSTVVNLLLDYKAHVCESINVTRLIENDIDESVLQRLIDAGAKVNGHDLATRRYWYPLQAAVGMKRSDIARLLLRHGAYHDNLPHHLPDNKSDRGCVNVDTIWEKQWRNPLTLALKFDPELATELLEYNQFLSGCYLDLWKKPLRPSSRVSCGSVASPEDWSYLRSEILRIEKSRHWGDYTALQAAITSKSVSTVELLLQRRAPIRCCHGTPPLILAVQVGHPEIVEVLLKYCANVDETSYVMDPRDWRLTALAEAAARDDVATFSRLLDHGADVNCCDREQGLTPLQAAVVCGAESCIALLLSHRNIDVLHPGSVRGVDAFTAAILGNDMDHFRQLCSAIAPSKSLPTYLLDRTLSAAITMKNVWFISRLQEMGANLYAESVLTSCTRSVTTFHHLLEAGLNIHMRWKDSSVADITFSRAIENCNAEVAQFILAQKAAISLETSQKLVTRLIPGSRFAPIENVDILLELVFKSRLWSIQPDDLYILIAAIKEIPYRPKARKIAERMIKIGMDSFIQPLHLETPLMAAADIDDSALIRFLLERGACPTVVSGQVSGISLLGLDYLTPLQIACRNGNITIARLLLSNGADVNQRATSKSSPPITLAVESTRDDLVELLIEHGADVNTRASEGIDGRTALQVACQAGRLGTVQLLLKSGADVNAAASPGYRMTALQAAAAGGYFNIVQILLNAGADIAAPASSTHGETALEAAARHGRLDTVALLLQQYEGTQPLQTVCVRAARLAEEQGHVAIARFLETYGIPVEPLD